MTCLHGESQKEQKVRRPVHRTGGRQKGGLSRDFVNSGTKLNIGRSPQENRRRI